MQSKKPASAAPAVASVLPLIEWGLLALLLYVPFHGLVSTWLTDLFGHPIIWKTGKDIVIVLLVLLGCYELFWRRDWLDTLWSRPVNKFIALYAGLHIALAMIFRPNGLALAAALIMNLRFFAVFVLGQLVLLGKNNRLLSRYVPFLLWPFLVTAVFAILQRFVLPDDFLKLFGYGPLTIPAMHTIDQQTDLLRYASTLRGPNELGAYLILPLLLAAALLRKQRKYVYGLMFAAGLAALYLSLSRSAWLGFSAGLLTLLWVLSGSRQRKQLLRWVALGVISGLVGLASLWHTNFVQQTFAHNDPRETAAIDSSTAHWRSSRDGLVDVAKHPLGRGPGNAGPASFRSNKGPVISENYFLQIGQETGWPGLALFGMICALVFQLLWHRKREPLATALIASFAGLALVNFFLHSWTDEALAVTWWLGAAITVSAPLTKKKVRDDN